MLDLGIGVLGEGFYRGSDTPTFTGTGLCSPYPTTLSPGASEDQTPQRGEIPLQGG